MASNQFDERMQQYAPELRTLYADVTTQDAFETMLKTAYRERSAALKRLDTARKKNTG